MEDKHFINTCNFIRDNLKNFSVTRVFNSIGSNVFFEFGKDVEVIFKNGRKRIQREWCIWIGHASWRMTKDDQYIVGSGDSSEEIQLKIQQLLDRYFIDMRFVSSYLDVEFNFSEGFRLTTFFNWQAEEQWAVFLPDGSNITVDCNGPEEIKKITELSKTVFAENF